MMKNVDETSTVNMQKILVAIDGSKQSLKAAIFGAYLAKMDKNTKLTLLYVVNVDKNVSAFDQVTTSGYVPVELKEQGFKILYKLKNNLIARENLSSNQIDTIIFTGNPSYVIVDTAINEKYDCILMGRRGLGKLKSILLGSVSHYVLQNAPCPVCIVN